jgi:hypothetical protein
MNSQSFGRPVVWLFFLAMCFCPAARAQQPVGQTSSIAPTNLAPQTQADPIAALELERTNAWQGVLQIVNQPVKAYARTPDYSVSIYSPGWFHEGATKPDFNTVDVRKSQELPYASHQYVSSDLNPRVMFMGRDLEFNSMTKFFYTDRSLPKHKLTEAEMLEVNRLYRIIGHSESEITRLQTPVTETVSSNKTDNDAESAVAPGQTLAGIRSIPQRTRALYGGIVIGALVLLVAALKFVRKKSD